MTEQKVSIVEVIVAALVVGVLSVCQMFGFRLKEQGRKEMRKRLSGDQRKRD